jgi:chemotaxis protein histidine kinase CheA
VEIDEFAERVARIRQRFAAALPKKIDDSFLALDHLSDGSDGAVDDIVVTHRRLHEMCGIASSIGFEATGKAARAAESVLCEPAKSKRALTAAEVEALKHDLDALRNAAQSDLQSMTSQG